MPRLPVSAIALLTLACGTRPTPPPPPPVEPSAAPAPTPTLVPPNPITVGAQWTTPGFVDAHAHPASLGRHLSRLRLNDLPTFAATQAAVKEAASTGDGWLHGRGWDQNDWSDLESESGFPTAAHLDAIVPDRPAALRRVGGHATWVNTAGLAAAGITKDTPDPDGGRILRDKDGSPIGILIDAAADLLPPPTPPTPDERRRQLVTGLDVMASAGLTGAHDMGVSDAILADYEALDAAGALKLRIHAYLNPDAKAVERLKADGPWCGTRFCVVGVKMYADGSLGSRGALLSDDYADEPGHRGSGIVPFDVLQTEATELLQAGAQLAVHAIGDAGVHGTLNAFEAARKAVPDAAAVPLRVEHAQVVRDEDLPRFKALNVIASMQPTHGTSDMPWAQDRLGPDRVGWSYRWRDVLDAGAILAFGSDFPVERVSPTYGMWSAVTRSDLAGQPAGGWRPDQRLTHEEAAHAFTVATTAAVGASARGFPLPDGDRTVWVAAQAPDGAGIWWRAQQTVVAGEVVWAADGAADLGGTPP